MGLLVTTMVQDSIQRDFQGFRAMEKGLSSKDAAKICLGYGAGWHFQVKDKKEKPFRDHHAA